MNDVADMLNFYKFLGDEIQIVRGLALSAILKSMEVVDQYMTNPVRQLDKPFLMPVEDVFSIQVLENTTYHSSVYRVHNLPQ